MARVSMIVFWAEAESPCNDATVADITTTFSTMRPDASAVDSVGVTPHTDAAAREDGGTWLVKPFFGTTMFAGATSQRATCRNTLTPSVYSPKQMICR